MDREIRRWAVVIGISDYKYDNQRDPKGVPDLLYANRDAMAFANFLRSPSGGAFSPDHVRLLTDGQATVKEVKKAIGVFLGKSLEQDLVIIYFSGHGAPDPTNPKNLYLICHDTEPDNYYGTALPMWEIDVALKETIPSKKVFVFADACHSAGIAGTRSASESASRFNEYMRKLDESKPGVTKITASRLDELSMEKVFEGEGGHGVFTYYLLKGLKGEADFNTDGFVTMKEGFDFLYDGVRSETQKAQNPWPSSYVSAEIPIGITDEQVIEEIKIRMRAAGTEPFIPAIIPPSPSPLAGEANESFIKLKIARTKLKKGEIQAAVGIIDEVQKQNDAAKPNALAMKIEIFLKEGDLKMAEDVEDYLVIPYRDHPAAQKGVRMIYRHYLERIEGKKPNERIEILTTYIKRHPDGLLVHEAGLVIDEIQLAVKNRFNKVFDDKLVLAAGLIKRNRFEKGHKELDAAGEIADEALKEHGLSLDIGRIDQLRLEVETAQRQYGWEKNWKKIKQKASRQEPMDRIATLEDFIRAEPGNSFITEAERLLITLKEETLAGEQKQYDALLSEASSALEYKDFARCLEKLDSAERLSNKVRDRLGHTLDSGDMESLRKKHSAGMNNRGDYLTWRKAEAKAKVIQLNDPRDYDRRIAVFKYFAMKWPKNPYTSGAWGAISDLKSEKTAFMKREFQAYFDEAKDYFVAGDYSSAHESLNMARRYAAAHQTRQIDELAERYNAPPEVEIILKDINVDWETPVQFSYQALDREGDPVRVVGWDFGDGNKSGKEKPIHTFAKWTGPDKKRKFTVALEISDDHTTVTSRKTVIVKKEDRIKYFTVNGMSFKMIRIPAGKYLMGSPSDEKGRGEYEIIHLVKLDAFWLGETEVTQGLWKAVMGNNPSGLIDCGDDCPVETISWHDTQKFIQKLNESIPGGGFRLPTEAQWEYACRAGSTAAYSWGNAANCAMANYGYYEDCKGVNTEKTMKVGSFPPNKWGLYDMHGNVWEWCQDRYGRYLWKNAQKNPPGPSNGMDRIVRGGSWAHNPRNCRSASRNEGHPGLPYLHFGFRLAR